MLRRSITLNLDVLHHVSRIDAHRQITVEVICSWGPRTWISCSGMGHIRRKSRAELCAHERRSLFLLSGPAVLAVAYKVWESALDARETANRIAKDACSRAVVQFLDGTVAFAGFRLARDSNGQTPAAAHLHLRLHE